MKKIISILVLSFIFPCLQSIANDIIEDDTGNYIDIPNLGHNPANQNNGNKIVVAADYWCPYNCHPGGNYEGFLIEILKKSLAVHGVAVEYRLMSWSKSVDDASRGKVDAVVGISDPDLRGLIKTEQPVEYSNLYAFTKKGSRWKYDGTDSLIGKKVGLVMDYQLNEALNHYIGMYYYTTRPGMFHFEDGTDAAVSQISNLIDGSIDVYIEDERVVNFYLKKSNMDKYIQSSGIVSSTKLPLYIAFARSNKKALDYIKYIEDEILALKASGEYEHLQRKYHMIPNQEAK